MDKLLGFPGLAGVVVEINDVMARFVAVPVFADVALDVGRALRVRLEQLVELLGEGLLAAHQRDQAGHVLRDVPRVLRGRGLGEVAAVTVIVRIERRPPMALRILAAHPTDRRVEVFL